MTTVPTDIPAERASLGSVLINADVMLSLVTKFGAGEPLSDERNRAVWTAMLACFGRRVRPDLVTIRSELEQQGTLERVGGIEYVVALSHDAFSWTAVDDYAQRVVDCWLSRRLIAAGGQIAQLGYQQTPTGLADAQALLDALGRLAVGGDVHRADVMIEASTAARFPKGPTPTTAPVIYGRTGINGWDDHLRINTRAKKKITLAGYTGFGKSTLAACAVRGLLIDGWQALIYTGEMPHDEVIDRYLTREARVTMTDLSRLDDLDTATRARVMDGYAAIEAWTTYTTDYGEFRPRLHVVDTRKTMQELEYIAANLRYQHPHPLVVMIDHLGLVKPPKGAKGRYEVTSENAIQAKQLAMEADCLVLELAQLTREISRDMKASATTAKPELHMLRDTGEIEQSADAVPMIQPSPDFLAAQEACETQAEREALTGIVDVYVRKNRNGPKGMFSLRADFAHYTMEG